MAGIEYIIAGLGNPGREYELTRHNAGFLCLDVLCNRYKIDINRMKFHALTADCTIRGHRCLVMRPQTYMNLSGDAIGEAASFYKVPPERVIVLFDDIDIPFGDIRVKRKGSAGTHNGVKSIVARLGSEDFPRIKIGVGHKSNEDMDLKDYVLGSFSKSEQDELKQHMEKAVDGVEKILDGRIDLAMQDCQIFSKKKNKTKTETE